MEVSFSSHLCEVIMILLPSWMSFTMVVHKNWRVTGSTPLVGSSNINTGVSPTNATAVHSFLFVPPLVTKNVKFKVNMLSLLLLPYL